MDILALLKKDHENTLLLFDELDQLPQKGAKRQKKQDQLFDQLRSELEVHMMGEETVFYPPLSEDEDIRQMVLESIEEHRVIKMIFAEMGAMPGDEHWDAKFRVLRENVERHIEEEEDDIFDNAEEILGSDQRNVMGNRMAEIKEEHLAAISR